jgi:hypothetical protein
MLPKRLFLGLVALAITAVLAVLGASARTTALAGPLAQQETSTATTTETIAATETVTATETASATATATITATETVTATETPPTATVTTTSTPGAPSRGLFWSYAVKFVCGEQAAPTTGGDPLTVAPGAYATEINVHNPNYDGPLTVYKRAVLLVDQNGAVGRDPATADPQAIGAPTQLGDGAATMNDCASIWELTNPGTTPPSPMPLTVGYLVILSPRELDVVGVLTAGAPATQATSGVSIDTLVVEPKQVSIPATIFPGGILPRGVRLDTATQR